MRCVLEAAEAVAMAETAEIPAGKQRMFRPAAEAAAMAETAETAVLRLHGPPSAAAAEEEDTAETVGTAGKVRPQSVPAPVEAEATEKAETAETAALRVETDRTEGLRPAAEAA